MATLEARPKNCWAHTYLLKWNDAPIGRYTIGWFNEDLQVQLLGGRRFRFERQGLLSHFRLFEGDSELALNEAKQPGVFEPWRLVMRSGTAELPWKPLDRMSAVDQGGEEIASLKERSGFCSAGWDLEGDLELHDALLIGLLYHTLLGRERRRYNT